MGQKWFPCTPPRTLRDRYQNVPMDVNFNIFDVPKKKKWAKFGFEVFLYNRVKKNERFREWGVG